MKKSSIKAGYSAAKTNTFSILLGMGIVIIVSCLSFSFGLLKGSGKLLKNSQIKSTPTPTTFLPIPCFSNLLGISLRPDYKWSCETRDVSATDSIMFLKSAIFEITISNLNRSSLCVADPSLYGYNSSCQITKLYSKSNLTLDLYKLDGVNKEIFGSIISAKNPPGTAIPWVLIKYKKMESKDLSENEKKELNQLLESLTSI
jgi:hypothetical protein